MHSRVNFGRGAMIVACVLMVALVVVAAAAAKPKSKPPFKPKVGDYSGKLTTPTGETVTTTGTVEKLSGKYFVELDAQFDGTCSDGTPGYPLSLRGLAPVKEKSFKLNGKSPNQFAAGGSANVEVKVTGHFTSTSTLVATASAETKVEAGNAASHACQTGTLKFNLKLG